MEGQFNEVLLYLAHSVNVLKFLTPFLFLFSNEMLVFRAGIHKMLVRIANREHPNQTALV